MRRKVNTQALIGLVRSIRIRLTKASRAPRERKRHEPGRRAQRQKPTL